MGLKKLLLGMAFGLAASALASTAMAENLRVLAWDGYADEDWVKEFTAKTGIGVDVHAYDAAEPLWLGGLYWPDEVGLAGHSDGDAMCHAICDALLSAAGLGDIGGKFGTDDPRFAGAHGEVFIAATVDLVTGAGYTVGNVAVQLIGNGPERKRIRAMVDQANLKNVEFIDWQTALDLQFRVVVRYATDRPFLTSAMPAVPIFMRHVSPGDENNSRVSPGCRWIIKSQNSIS